MTLYRLELPQKTCFPVSPLRQEAIALSIDWCQYFLIEVYVQSSLLQILLFKFKGTGTVYGNIRSVALQVAAMADLMLAYVDFFLGGDEKRVDLPARLHQRFPMSIIFGGDGSYMAPFSLQSDNILTSLMSQVCSILVIRFLHFMKA